jgi:hypothetical protein
MRKVPGVTAVRVSLNEGLTILDFNQGNTVTLVQLRTILKNSGFVSREARLEAIGSATADGQGLVLTVSGTGEKFALLAGGTTRTAFEALKGRTRAGPVAVQLKGTASAADGKMPSLVLDTLQ